MTRTFRVDTVPSLGVYDPPKSSKTGALASGPEPTYTRALARGCQYRDLRIDPRIQYQVDRAIKALRASHKATGGATVSLAHGDLAGRPLFAVAAFPKRTVRVNAVPTAHDLWHFIMDNLDVVSRRERAVGTWFDKTQGIHDLDVVAFFEQLDHALNVAARLGERFIYDLSARVEIAVAEALPSVIDSVSLRTAGTFGLRGH